MNKGELCTRDTARELKINLSNNNSKVYFLEGLVIDLLNVVGNTTNTKVYNYSQSLTLVNKISMGGSFETDGKQPALGH